MPQMAPMWWMFLMTCFMLVMMYTITYLYFNFYVNILMKKSSKKKEKFNWKW